jgi:TolB-like protein/DNA-binding winged helix-turn-helix (wHTH) protein
MTESAPTPAGPGVFQVDDLVIDVVHRRVTRAGAELELSSLSFDLLLELVRAAPNVVTIDELMQRVWPRLVVGPETVSQRVKLIRDALGDDANAPRYISGVRGRGYRLVAAVTARTAPEPPPTPTSTPAPAPSPSPPSPSSPAVEPGAATARVPFWRRRAFAVSAGAVLLVVLAYGIVGHNGPGRVSGSRDLAVAVQAPSAAKPPATSVEVSPPPDESIAVLPFVDLSEQGNQEYFSDGLAEELINLLTKLPDLRVPARTSSFYFKGQHTTVAEMARALHVANILEGSVRTSGNRVRVTAQLIRADNGYTRWSQTYDRKLDDIFKVQEEIAGAVAQALKVELQTGALNARTSTANMAVYTLALKGRYFLERNAPGDAGTATEFFRQATELDPSYAPAWAGFARAIFVQGDLGSIPWDTARVRSHAAAQRAIELDPRLPEAHTVLAKLLANDEDWSAAQRELDTALTLDPGDAATLMNKAQWANALENRPDEAIRLAQRATERDPLRPTTHYRLCWIYFDSGHLQEAAASCQQTLELSPNYAGAHFSLAALLLARDQPEAALAEAGREPDEAFLLRGLAIVHFRLGHARESDAALATLIEKYATKRMLFIASVYTFRGQADSAFEWLRRARAQKENQLFEVKSRAMFGQLKGDPRYKGLLREMKLPE